MAQIVKLRRSSVSGQKPTNSNLQLGELALNTTDGKVFMAVSGSLGPSVEELISTNTVNTGSIHLIGDITASHFTGSFKGDGINLYNIPASGVTGLNLTRIADGNATASISNTQGLRINTNTEITGSLIVSSGSAVFDAALQLTENSSLILNSGSNLYVYDGGIISGTFKGNGALLTDLPYATTASNHFNGDQTITGSVFITENLTVLGSSSIVYVTSSQLDIATNIIKVNASNPSVRFGGLSVIDSGSSPQVSGSLLFDSIKDEWIFVHQAIVGSPTTSSVFLLGPETYGDLGNETYLTQNRIPKGSGIEHLRDSNITDTGTKVSINSNTEITGSLITTGTIVSETTPLVSGSSQIQITGTTGYSDFSSSVSTSIGSLSSSIATTTNDLDGRLDSIELTTGSLNTYTSSNTTNINAIHTATSSLNSFTASYSTGSFTGSFIGNGVGLYNIPATGVTGLQLDKIVSGNASASINNNGFYVNRDVYVDGTITAKEIHTDYVTSSVLFQSGSTKFGNTSDDTHQFTGSVYITGSIVSSDTPLVSGSSQIDITNTTGYSTFSSSIKNSIDDVTGSITNLSSSVKNSIDSVTGSITALSSSVKVRIDDVTGSITALSSSVKVRIDDVTGSITNLSSSVKNSIDDVTGSITALSSSVKVRIDDVTGSITALSSSVKVRIDDVTGSITTLSSSVKNSIDNVTGSITSLSSSVKNSFDTITGSITSLSSSVKVRIDSLTGSIDSLNTFSSSVVLTSQTSSMSVLSASYAVTAAFALNAGGGGGQGTTYVHTQSSASTTWTVTHNLGERYPAIVVFDSSGNVIVPTNISAQSTSTLVVTFSSAQTGKVSATVGGGLPHISASYEGRVLAVHNDEPIWKAGIISGSQQLGNLGFATTGSNTFYGNQIISGTTTIGNAAIGSKCVTISSNTALFNLGTFDGANFDYVVKNGSNMRAGLIMSVWDGSFASYNESSTMDLGSTSGVTFTVSGLGVLTANIASGTWTVEVLYRALGCSTISPPSSPSSTNYSISTGYTAPNYCDGLFGSDQTVYGNDSAWTSVTRFYTNSGMTTPFNGGSLWYGDSTAYFGTTLQIDSDGYVIDSYAC
jgi:hypothetical protein